MGVIWIACLGSGRGASARTRFPLSSVIWDGSAKVLHARATIVCNRGDAHLWFYQEWKWIEAGCLSSHMWFFSHHTHKYMFLGNSENYGTGSTIDLRRR
jgi:hypothetical protein